MLTSKRVDIGRTEFWDNVAIRENENKELMETLTEKQLEKLQLDTQDTLLEVGPGYGRLTVPLAKTVKRITVVEPSINMLLFLQKMPRSKVLTTSVTLISDGKKLKLEKTRQNTMRFLHLFRFL